MRAEEFIRFLTSEKHYSPHTITAYKNDLAQFIDFCASTYEIDRIEDVDHQIVRSWLAHLVQSGATSRSVNRKLSALKAYYRFLLKHDIIHANPMQKVISPKGSMSLPVFVEKSRMDRLLDAMPAEGDFKSLRNRLVMEILYATGMRVSELVSLKHKDINFETKVLIVTGKRNKQRIIPFGSQLHYIINEYIVFKEKHLGSNNPNDYLIITDKGKQSYTKLIYNIVTHSLGLVTTQSKKSPHVIRHTFATAMLNNGADLNSIKELLGHSNLAATQIYTHNTIDRIKRIYQQAHPKA